MGSSTFLLFSYAVLLSLTTLNLSDDDVYFEHNCSEIRGNYTANSTYQANLNSIISQFSSLTEINYGFFNLSAGVSPDKVNVIALCRGDLDQDQCNNCLNYTATKLERFCPSNKEATAWSELCLVRYANRDIYGKLENDPRECKNNPKNASNPDQFNQALSELLNALNSKAAAGGPLRKYAAGNATAGNLQTIFATAQCTPDLDEGNCTTCLTYAMGVLRSCCYGWKGCRVLRPNCVLRFESNLFYSQIAVPLPSPSPPPPPSPTASSSPTSKGGNGNNTTRTVIIVIASVVGILILIIISICIFMRRRKTPKKFETKDEITGAESLQIDFDSVLAATNNFSDANKLGQGGFGAVYKGQLPNGQEVAVKRLSRESQQGDLEFKNEVLLLAKLQHRNLVRFLGFSLEEHEKILIYEFVPNRSLDHFIFDRIKRAQLDWETRYKIIGGIARGLLYLHEDSRLRIIHRDLKASNILLDADMTPKISDFGMARLFGQDETQGSTIRIVGTYGYMAPEYAIHGHFSVKSDVFSFGVLLLEIISGQKNNCFRHGENNEYILNFAWKNWREGTALNVIDPTLSDGSRNETMRCIHIALLCVQENVARRPTMASVVFMLNSFSTTLPVPSQPAFCTQSNIETDMSSSLATNSWASESNNSNMELRPSSLNEVSVTELSPR
ncbi:putative receptor-like protein kinase At4g00960 isoform X2 [Durio zibethinus]|uniref:Receptor-like protein kinase At4g00960 isoform X2 n=1 Tax=Durio zibethinus TaxID=66656 RepID=A0A6P5WY45_DURZI|nr:putative receptor-like protein kinase At4g00960 isoform X2 [Durio zibethinus]